MAKVSVSYFSQIDPLNPKNRNPKDYIVTNTPSMFYLVPKGSKNIRFELPLATFELEKADTFNTTVSGHLYNINKDPAKYGLNASDADFEDKLEKVIDDLMSADQATLNTLADGWVIYPRNGIVDTTWDKRHYPFTKSNGIPGGKLMNIRYGIPYDTYDKHSAPATGKAEWRYMLNWCSSHQASLQVFHTDGTLLTGSLLTNYDKSRGEVYGDSNWPSGIPIIPLFSPTGSYDSDDAAYYGCGLWNDWYCCYTATTIEGGLFVQNDANLPARGTIITPSMVSDALKTRHPNVFPSTFTFNDTTANDGKGEVIKRDDTTMHRFTSNGEDIQWSGSVAGTIGTNFSARSDLLGLFPFIVEGVWGGFNNWDNVLSALSKPFESLFIAEAKDDLIIGAMSYDGFSIFGEWEDPSSPPEPPEPPEPVPVPATCDRPRMWQKREANEGKHHFGL